MRTKSPSCLRQALACLSGALLALVLTCAPAQALPTVKTIGGGYPLSPYSGHVNGDTFHQALFNNPVGLAVDQSGEYLFVADRDNNTVRLIDFDTGVAADFGTTADFLTMTNYVVVTNLFSKPVGVVIDSSYNIFVLNRAASTNGYILQFSPDGELVATNMTKIANAGCLAIDSATNLYVTASTNVYKVSVNTHTTTLVATVHDASANLKGITVKRNGLLAVCDYGRNGILLINPVTGIITTNAGFHGVGDFTDNVHDSDTVNTAKFNGPIGVAETGDGTLIVSDNNNNRVKAVLTSGAVTNIYGVSSAYWGPSGTGLFPGQKDGQVALPDSISPNVQSRLPNGIAYANDGSIYVSEDFYHIIRKVTGAGLALFPPPPQPPPTAPSNLTVVSTTSSQVTLSWAGSGGATNYFVERAPSSGGPYTVLAVIPDTGAQTYTYTDTTALNGATNYYVIVANNTFGQSPNSAEVAAFPPVPPVSNPQIGYLDFPVTSLPIANRSVFHPVSFFSFNNDAYIVIEGQAGSQTFYNLAATPTNGTIPAPTSSSSQAPSGYADGLIPSDAAAFAINQPGPDITIRAIGEETNAPNSAITQARFQFITANPIVVGANAANFQITDITTSSHLYYTLDGTDPSATNPTAIDLGVSQNSSNYWAVTLSLQTNALMKIIAVRPNYQSSSIVSNLFLYSNFQPTTISFGFATGEGSSAFIASPGQTFYAPITLSLVNTPSMYSLIFNLVVTNGAVNSGPPIPPASFGFQSMLEKPVPGQTTVFETIPPAQFVGLLPKPNPVTLDGSTAFSSLLTTNTAENLLAIGWSERLGATNLYDTTKQTLITYSQAHDTQFLSTGNKVIVGGFNIVIPQNAQPNQTYQIQIGRPSATSDGIGANVSIGSPTNGGTGAGTVNALKYITVGQFKYIVGSATPFRWFNAGDFGSSNIVSADVQQVFQSAIYGLNTPPAGSDFFDTMDSSGNLGALDSNPADSNFGDYTNANPLNVAGNTVNVNPLFDGNDTTIDQDAFGDGKLDVDDVYVTFRRALDPSRTWFRRFWNNGQRVADTAAPNIGTGNKAANVVTTKSTATPAAKPQITNSIPPLVNFSAGDIIGSAGQTVQVPISATIVGNYPLRFLMLNVNVTPLDGSPALTTAVSFSQSAAAAALGTPYDTAARGLGNFAAVWINSGNTGLSNTVTIGTLSVQIPPTANSNSAYAISFGHASASPNGLATFPNHVLTGVLSTSARTNSVYLDGIPDSWRLRWFGTTNNLLSVSNACPTTDGVNNWYKYVAGVDPNVAGSFPQTKTKSPSVSGYNYAIHWPSVNGKKYVIERASGLFGVTWGTMATNTGTGNDMEWDDNTTNKVKFYRVRILP